MKKLVFAALFLLLGTAVAQEAQTSSPLGAPVSAPTANVTEKLFPVTRTDVYCAGFATKEPVSKANFVAGGVNTPQQTRFGDRDIIFIKGANLQPGSLVTLVREIRNPDAEIYSGAEKLQKEIGKPYMDTGYARITELRAEVAVAQVEFTCGGILPGDLVLPFMERPTIATRISSTLDRFPADKPALAGKIAMVENFEQIANVGRKVFITLGWNKGVKCGDYFSITRRYSKNETDSADAYSYDKAEVDDTQVNAPQVKSGNMKKVFPRRVVGELIVLNVTPTSATGMITFALEDIHAGDAVELEPRDGESMVHSGTN